MICPNPKPTQICFNSVLIVIIVISNTMVMMVIVKIMVLDGVDENDDSEDSVFQIMLMMTMMMISGSFRPRSWMGSEGSRGWPAQCNQSKCTQFIEIIAQNYPTIFLLKNNICID